MGKLHEVIAVEPELRAKAASVLRDAIGRLQNSAGLLGMRRSYQPLEEGGETFQAEMVRLQTNVKDVLDLAVDAWVKYVNVSLEKEYANTHATADMPVLGNAVPATALLNLEQRLGEMKALIEAIPTLDPAEEWRRNDAQGYWESAPAITYRTKKVPRAFVKAEATDRHPAQVEMLQEDIRAGTWSVVKFSGQVTVGQKQKWLERTEELLRKTKQARQRANEQEAETIDLGHKLVAAIFGE